MTLTAPDGALISTSSVMRALQARDSGDPPVQAAYDWDGVSSALELAARAPVKTAAARAKPKPTTPPPPAPPRRRTGITPLTPLRAQAAKSMSRLADKVKESHPDLPAAQHLMDAARTLRQGQHEASQRHLRAAIFSLTPQSLMRNGMHTDDLHTGARAAMHGVHRHLLLVKDLDDVAAKNQAAITRDSYGDDATSMTRPDPNAGFGAGALAQKPTARQPGGDKALNAPSQSSSGGSDPNVADPVGPQPKGSRQFARNWDELAAVIDLSAVELDWTAYDRERAHATASATAKATAARRRAAAGKKWVYGAGDLNGFPGDMSDEELAEAEKQAKAAKAAKALRDIAVEKANRAHKRQVMARPRPMYYSPADASMQFSSETGRLAVSPAPRGKPGGPGLYGVKGNMHSPYLQNIVKALIRKGMPPGKAYAIAWGSMRRWAKGGGKVHPEVRAAAAGSLGLEKVAEARAHAHAVTWDEVAGVVELAAAVKAPPGPQGPSLYDRYVAQVQQLQAAVAVRMQAASARKAITASGVKVPAAPPAPAPAVSAAPKPKAAAVPVVPAKQGPPAPAVPATAAAKPALAVKPAAPAASSPAAPTAPPGKPAATPPAASGTPEPPATIPQLQAKIAALTAQLATLIKASGPAAKTPVPAPPAGQSHAATRAGAVELAPTTGQPRQAGGGQQSAAQRAEPRVPAGQPGGGQFGSAGQPAAKGKPDAHQQHVAHVQAQAKQKAGLLNTAKADRAKAATLIAQRKALMAQLASASGKTSSGQAGSTTTAAGSTTASSAPAAAATASASSGASSATAPTSAQLTSAIAGLTTQINGLLAAAATAQAQAAKMP